MKQVVCTYEASDNFGFAVPDNTRFGTDIFIPKERSKGAMSGHKVVVEITSYGKKGKKPEGKVVEIIGHIDDTCGYGGQDGFTRLDDGHDRRRGCKGS